MRSWYEAENRVRKPGLEANPLGIYIMWQSRIDVENYSVAYFERITEFDGL